MQHCDVMGNLAKASSVVCVLCVPVQRTGTHARNRNRNRNRNTRALRVSGAKLGFISSSQRPGDPRTRPTRAMEIGKSIHQSINQYPARHQREEVVKCDGMRCARPMRDAGTITKTASTSTARKPRPAQPPNSGAAGLLVRYHRRVGGGKPWR